MNKQVLVIHGGNVFPTYKKYLADLKAKKLHFDKLRGRRWKEGLEAKLGRGYEVIMPKMPCADNARYLEWKIWLEKILPHLRKDIILVGHSLGGIFLAKYLSENKLRKKVRGVFLVAAPFANRRTKDSLYDFNLANNLKLLDKQAGKIFLYQSKDDEVVPFADLEKYLKLLPSAVGRVFKDRGHFTIADFPEIIRDIKNI